MGTLKLKKPVASGKFKVIFHKNKIYYYEIDGNLLMVHHDTNPDAIIPVLKKDAEIID